MTKELEQVIQKAETWLNGNYDAETKAQVRAMLEADDKTELVDCAALWVQVPTE